MPVSRQLRTALWALCFVVLPAAPSSGTERPEPDDYGRIGFAFLGGVQKWSLSTPEDLLSNRIDALAGAGFPLDRTEYPSGPTFGFELRYRFHDRWHARFQTGWFRTVVEDRAGDTQEELGGAPRWVSVGYRSEVRTRPLLISLGIQRAVERRRVRFAWGGGVVVVPLETEDTADTRVDQEETETMVPVVARGTGIGLELSFVAYYRIDGPNTVFVDTFYRNGSARVDLLDSGFDSASTPSSREVEFTGAGIRLGVGWK